MPPAFRDLLLEFVERLTVIAAEWTGDETALKEPVKAPLTKTLHDVFDADHNLVGQETFIMEQQESRGTRKFFALAGFMLKALEQVTPLVIDEIESSMHPLLTLEIIRLFNDPHTTPCTAQLIFATHDTNILSRSLLRRDQIWFTEKDAYGATALYSLAELQARNDAAFDKQYIAGRYGAIPYLGGLRSLFEESAHGTEA